MGLHKRPDFVVVNLVHVVPAWVVREVADVAGTRALVEALVCLLGGELELTHRAGEEGLRGLEGTRHG